MRYSFLLVNYNMSGLTAQVIASIARQFDDYGEYEILIADNSSDPANAFETSAVDPRLPVRVTRIENHGFVHALNILIAQTQADYVMIMHPDVELEPGCVSDLSEFLDNHAQAGVVSPDLYYPDGTPNRIRLRNPTVTTELRRLANILLVITTGKRRMRDEVFWDRRSDPETETVMSVCMMFRGEALRQVGPVDPRLVFYYANDYLCWRSRTLGWTCHYVRSARAIHYERYALKALYSSLPTMAYKESTVAANARMRADYFCFVSHVYWIGSRVALRAVALIDDGLQLLSRLRRPHVERENIRRLLQSIRVDIGLRP